MTFDAATLEAIRNAARVVIDHTAYQAIRADASDVAEFVAHEVIDLVEWCSPTPDLHTPVAKLVLDSATYPAGVRLAVCSYFNLPY
jgi:hypothetical protein